MKKSLIAAVFVIAMTMVAMPSFASTEPVGYNATVMSTQDTSVTSSSSNFGSILAGSTTQIYKSVNLSNTGGWTATVDAKFITNNGTSYGLKNGSNMIVASYFSLKNNASSQFEPLINGDTDTRITTVPATSTASLDAQLYVPTGTSAGSYNGTVLLIFGNE